MKSTTTVETELIVTEENQENEQAGTEQTSAGNTRRTDIAIRISDGHTWKRVSVQKADSLPEKGRPLPSKMQKKITEKDLPSFRQIKPHRRKLNLPFEAPRETRNIPLISAVYEDELKKKRFYVLLGKFKSFAGAYLFWLAHPEYPAVIVRTGYSEFEVRAGDYNEEEYKELKAVISALDKKIHSKKD